MIRKTSIRGHNSSPPAWVVLYLSPFLQSHNVRLMLINEQVRNIPPRHSEIVSFSSPDVSLYAPTNPSPAACNAKPSKAASAATASSPPPLSKCGARPGSAPSTAACPWASPACSLTPPSTLPPSSTASKPSSRATPASSTPPPPTPLPRPRTSQPRPLAPSVVLLARASSTPLIYYEHAYRARARRSTRRRTRGSWMCA